MLRYYTPSAVQVLAKAYDVCSYICVNQLRSEINIELRVLQSSTFCIGYSYIKYVRSKSFAPLPKNIQRAFKRIINQIDSGIYKMSSAAKARDKTHFLEN